MDQNNMFDHASTQSEEVLFENIHTRSKAFFKEFYTYYFFKRPIFFVLHILMAASLIINLLDFFLGDSNSLVGVIAPALYVLFVFWASIVSARTASAREKENGNGSEIVYHVKVTDTTVGYSTSLGNKYEMEFSKIKKVYTTQNYILLQTPTKQVYPIKKDGFTKGTYTEFCAFLQSKNFNIKTK